MAGKIKHEKKFNEHLRKARKALKKNNHTEALVELELAHTYKRIGRFKLTKEQKAEIKEIKTVIELLKPLASEKEDKDLFSKD